MTEISATLKETSKGELERLFQLQKAHEYVLAEQPIKYRKQLLKKLLSAIQDHRQDIRTAMHADFKKPALEVDSTEILPTVAEIKHAMRNIYRWTANKPVRTPMSLMGTSSRIVNEPKGVSLIISPWNFPFLLTLCPLVSAIAAGCPVILKPSEISGNSSAVLKKIIKNTFEENEVALVEGGVQTSTDLLSMAFKHIYFTGAPSIGKIVMKAAAEHLASVTLELGGKSPAIVDETADIQKAAKRIVWGRYINTGQVCIAPDYVLLHEKVKEKFIEEAKQVIKEHYGSDPQVSDSYPRMVSDKHYKRVQGYIEESIKNGDEIVIGGTSDMENNYIEPTIILSTSPSSDIMNEEIFGPVLPIKTFSKLSEATEIIASKEKPLALYIYSAKRKNINYLIKNTRAGGTTINHSILHIFNPNLPFGGTNNSGIGKGMGHFGFLEFTNQRGVLKQHFPWSAAELAMPPYTKLKSKLIRITERWLT